MSAPEKDIVRCIIDWMMQHEPSITEQLALECEREIRREWGGERPYIAADAKRQPHVRDKVISDALTDTPTPEILRRHGISRSTMYRMLKRGPAGQGGAGK